MKPHFYLSISAFYFHKTRLMRALWFFLFRKAKTHAG